MQRYIRYVFFLALLVGAFLSLTGHVSGQGLEPSAVPTTDNPLDGADIDATLVAWQVILGVIASIITTFANRLIPGVSPDDSLKRAIVTAVMCVVVAMIETVLRGTFNTANVLASLVVVFASAVTFYRSWFATSTLAARIEGKRVPG